MKSFVCWTATYPCGFGGRFGGTGAAVTVSGSVIAHGVVVSTAGYPFVPADSNSKVAIAGGGLTTAGDLTLSAPVYVGAPQPWNVATGKTLTVSGALHTIISDLTFSGAGDTIISAPIDRGGVINIFGGVKPGGLIRNGNAQQYECVLARTRHQRQKVPIDGEGSRICRRQRAADGECLRRQPHAYLGNQRRE